MTNETIGHYGFHPGGGYQPTKTNKIEFKEPPRGSGLIMTHNIKIPKELREMLGNVNDNDNGFGWSRDKGFYGKKQVPDLLKQQTSDLELKIREDVMKILGEICHSYEYDERVLLVDKVKDRLNLLWGE